MDKDQQQYEKPTVVEYGDLRELTEAIKGFGDEDGADKDGPFAGTGRFSQNR